MSLVYTFTLHTEDYLKLQGDIKKNNQPNSLAPSKSAQWMTPGQWLDAALWFIVAGMQTTEGNSLSSKITCLSLKASVILSSVN